MKSRLVIDGVSVAFLSELPVSVNRSVKDVREPDKTMGTFSKSISIPGSPEVIRLFENCFEVNAATSNFNANLKTPAQYYVNEVRVFNGSLQLLKIINKWENPYMPHTFECSLIGDTGGLFMALAGKLLEEIDMSDLDHNLTLSQPVMSDPKFNPTMGTGYAYGYADYGTNTNGTPFSHSWFFDHLKPAIFQNEYVYRMVADAGFSFQSPSHFDTAHAKSVVIPCVNAGRLSLPSATITANQFSAGKTLDTTTSVSGTYTGFSNDWTFPGTSLSAIVFDDDSTQTYFDGNSLYSTVNGKFIVSVAAHYDITAAINFDIVINPPASTVGIFGTLTGLVHLEQSVNSGATWTQIQSTSINLTVNQASAPAGTPITVQTNAVVTMSGLLSAASTEYRVTYQFNACNVNMISGNTAGSCSIDYVLIGDPLPQGASRFYAQIIKADLPYGGYVAMNDTIPKDISQLDFFTSIIKEENLYIEVDKDDSTLYHIHTREEFYGNDVLKWSDKVDISKDEEIIPMGELSFKRYTLTRKQDSDYYNKLYYDKWKEVYGTHIEEIDNEFVKDEKKIESIFSATPCATWNGAGVVAPRFYTYDPATSLVKPLKCNIRRLIFKQVTGVFGATHSLYYNGLTNLVAMNQTYPSFCDFDHPTAPTDSINFGIPRQIFYDYPAAYHTTNTRYNEMYSKYISEISDRDSKLVRLWVNLDENDFYNFSFRKKIWINNCYYRVNKIIDYDPQEKKSTQVELLKLTAGPVFVPGTISVGLPDNGGSGSSNKIRNNGGAVGQDNYNYGISSFVSGDSNKIGQGASYINLLDSYNVRVNGLVEGFTGIGLEDEDIDETSSNTMKIGKLTYVPVATRSDFYTANFDTSIDIDKYFLDASGGDFDGTLYDTGIEYTFIMKSTGTVTLVPDSGLINGAATYLITGANTKLTAVYDGTNWYI